jgi:putative oxidoreductase
MEMLVSLVKTNGDFAVATARIVLGFVLFAHGTQKLLGGYGGPGFAGTVQTLTTHLKLPRPVAVLVIFTEFLGGPRQTLESKIRRLGINKYDLNRQSS